MFQDLPSRLVVCDGCCCSPDPGPLRDTGVGLRVSECLGPCAHKNVTVVHPGTAARRRGVRPVWLGLLNSEDAVQDLADWVTAGGPGLAPIPATLELHVINAPVPAPKARRGI